MKKPLLVVSALVLAVGGGLYAVFAKEPPIRPDPAELSRLGIDPTQYARVRHDVTAQMEVEAKAATQRVAPPFERLDVYGKAVAVRRGSERPKLVLFIKHGCPCSIDAQPLFNRLARKFKDRVDFIGIIDKDGKEFSTQFQVAFPVIEEPSNGLMKAYDARASVYSAIVARNGHILKMWPGYSAGYLKEMNGLLAKAAAVEETPFDPQYAPVEKASGCPFM